MAISGGSPNPPVAVELLVCTEIVARDVVPYVVAELAGVTLAGWALVVSQPSSSGKAANWGAPSPAGSISAYQGTLLVTLMTWVLMLAVLCTAIDTRALRIGGYGIGIAVLCDVLFGRSLTGAAMNPARATVTMIAGAFLPSCWYI